MYRRLFYNDTEKFIEINRLSTYTCKTERNRILNSVFINDQ